jgi:hypothetical protein
MTEPDKISPDKIQKVTTDANNRVLEVLLNDGNKFLFDDFKELFKSKLRTLVAGEIVTWDEEQRYQAQGAVTAKTIEEHLKVVEAEGLITAAKLRDKRKTKMGAGIIVIAVIVFIALAVVMKILGIV